MKKLLAILPLILLIGCASTGSNTIGPVDDGERQKSEQIVSDSVPYIKAISAAAVRLALQYAETNPDERESLKGEINIVASNLDGLLTRGQFNPNAVTSSLKVKEKYVSDVLAVISTAYSLTYDKLVQNHGAGMAVKILEALASGVKEGTNP